MKNLLMRACIGALALLAAPALAQHATTSVAPNGAAPEVVTVQVAATSTPLLGTVTPTSVTPTSGAATFSSGSAIIGPLIPEFGRDVLVELDGPATGTAQLFTSFDGCTTLTPITIVNMVWATWDTFPINESPTTAPSIAGRAFCLKVTLTSGSSPYRVQQ